MGVGQVRPEKPTEAIELVTGLAVFTLPDFPPFQRHLRQGLGHRWVHVDQQRLQREAGRENAEQPDLGGRAER